MTKLNFPTNLKFFSTPLEKYLDASVDKVDSNRVPDIIKIGEGPMTRCQLYTGGFWWRNGHSLRAILQPAPRGSSHPLTVHHSTKDHLCSIIPWPIRREVTSSPPLWLEYIPKLAPTRSTCAKLHFFKTYF